MKRRLLVPVLALVLLAVALVAGILFFLGGESQPPGASIVAIPLPTQSSTGEPAIQVATEVPAALSTEPAGDGPVIFQLSQDGSEVRFILNEVLRGQPTTVVGASNQVAGEFALDLADASTVQVGVIQVNARALETDSDRRNRAIREFILQSDTYEFITFTPTEVLGLAGPVAVGQTIGFQIGGDLSIRDVIRPAVFDVSATIVEPGRIEGQASTTIDRSEFDLRIPSVPFVADVDEIVRLEIQFIAAPSG